MKAAAVTPKKRGTLRFVDVSKPVIGSDEVLVKVIRVGLDGTDKEIGKGYYGEAPKGSKFLIVGHESLGVVEKIGTKARSNNLDKGDYVVATVRRPDNCANCRAGESDMCLTGNYTERGIKGAHGYMAEYYKERPENLVRIPDRIKDSAVMLEPLSIAEKAVMQPLKIQERMLWKPKTAVVLGTGTVGLFAAMLLRLKGINVISVDRTARNPVKDRIYSSIGMKHINSNVTRVNSIPKLAKRRIDIVVDLTGSPEMSYVAMSMIGTNGIASLASVTGGKFNMQVDMAKLNYDMVLGNKVVVGVVNSNKSYFESGVRDMMKIEKSHKGILGSMITNKIAFDEFKSYDILDDRSQIKNVVELEDNEW